MKILILFAAFAEFVQIVLPQEISITHSLVGGTKLSSTVVTPIYPAGYGLSRPNITPGGRDRNQIAAYNGSLYTFHGGSTPQNDVWAFNITSRNWTWIAGKSDTTNPSFGQLGVAVTSNTPGFRSSFGGEVHYDRNAYYLFGGDSGGLRGDLWSFSFISNSWKWIAGLSSPNEATVYGSIGVATASTTPGARIGVVCSVHLTSGDFLVFAGERTSYFADVWAFSFATMRWTWISGSSLTNAPGVSGTKGQWSASFYPKSRAYFDAALDSHRDIFYLFGGLTNSNIHNDLWAFNKNTLEWSWLGGSTSATLGTCGVKGVSSLSNIPGARSGHWTIYHKASQLLVTFGGEGHSCTGSFGYLADMWAFDPVSLRWTWIDGASQNVNRFDNDYSVLPGMKYGAAAYDDTSQITYQFGGYGYLSSSNQGQTDSVWASSLHLNQTRLSSSSINFSIFTTKLSSVLFRSESVIAVSAGSTSISESFSSYTSSTPQTTDTLLGGPSQIQSNVDVIETSFQPPEQSDSAVMPDFSTFLSPAKSTAAILPAGTSKTSWSWLWSFKYYVLGGALLLIIVACCWTMSLWLRRRKPHTQSSKATAPSITEFSSDLSVTSSDRTTTGQTTMLGTSMGLYLPGGLQVRSAVAYRVESEIAKGGGGSVWIATAFAPSLLGHGPRIIVKIPNAAMDNERDVALFTQEIALMNAFKNHINIAKLLGYSQDPCSIILKYYPRGSLSKWVASETRSLIQVHSFIKDISAGLSVLHANGVVHCDLKPDNVLIDDTPKLVAVITDFGIARIVSDRLLQVSAYQVQFIRGASIAYAAPETVRELRQGTSGHVIDEANTMPRDLYALGLIMLAILNGKNAWK